MRWLAGWFFRRILPQWPYPVIRGPLRGCWFILGAAAGEAGGVSVHLGRAEPEQTRQLVDALRPGRVFFDVGANVGYYSLLAAKCVGPSGLVVALEPVPRNLSFLYRHLQLNKFSNVRILPVACSDQLALTAFATETNPAIGHLMEEAAACGSGDLLTATVALDEVVDALGVRPDVIKIDVEGAELRVLRGACETLKRARPRILLEIHSEELRVSCLDYLTQLGYRMRSLGPAGEYFGEPESDQERKLV